jgi:O-antigen ligase
MIALVLFRFLEKNPAMSLRGLYGQKGTKLFMLFIILFVWQVIGLLFTDSINSGAERIFKRASFILFPMALFLPAEGLKLKIRILLRFFVLFILIYLIYCVGVAFNNSITIKDGEWIFNQYHELYTYESFFVGSRLSGSVHPTYLSMYLVVALLISLDTFFDQTIKTRSRAIWLFLSIIFLFFVFLLVSRAGILAVAIVLPVYLIIRLYKRISSWIIISILALFFLISGIMIWKNSRLNYTIEDISMEHIDKTIQEDARLLIWRSANGIIKNNWLFGVGTGDASSELKKEFLERGYSQGYYDNLNAHNQFLEIMLENGIIGLILFLGILGFMCFIAIKDHNYLLMLFLVTMVVFFMFESILNRLAGITFFPLFTFLLVHLKSRPVTE